ncbi:MAG: minor capsid protein [Planctomycetes bacterium]|nr:minor capsid protein [Planctomycetota bacterium]
MKRSKKKTKKARPVKTPKNPEVRYRKHLESLVKRLKGDVNANIIPILRQFESEYVNDGYARTLEEAFDNLRKSYIGINVQAKTVANAFTSSADNANKQRFYSAIEGALGVDLSTVVQNEGLEDILIATTRENVGLIKSIPDEYFKKIESLVFSSTVQGNTAGSMIKQIQHIGKVTSKRAKLIARDQSSKLNSALSQQRQQNLGVEEYVWRTAKDDRVRETHRSKNGKTFRWDDPPKDTGHPGQDIQCRCVAQPIIKL